MTPTILAFVLATAVPIPGADPGPLMLRINLPEHRLEVVDGLETIRSYPATIGTKRHPTPTGRFQVSSITWNPWWNPPSSDWARGKKKTPPGPGNPMGRVKLRFDRLLYVHGTSNEEALGSPASHGCIRISNEDVLDLARLIALRTGALDADEVAALEKAPRRTREVALPGEGLPILIEYRLVKEGENGVERYDDPYDLGLRSHEEWLLENAVGESPPASPDAPAVAPATPPVGPGFASLDSATLPPADR